MSNKVLFVDDDENILNAYRRNLRKEFKIETALGGEKGLETIKSNGPFAVVVSDMKMPVMNGVQFLSNVKKIAPDTVRMILTGYAEIDTAIEAINGGHIFRFLTKPCTNETLTKALSDGIKQYRLITSEKELLEKTLKGTIKLLADILEVLSPAAFSRSLRVYEIAKKIGSRLNIKEKWQIEIASMLSQIGCVTIPTEIIQKKYKGKKLSQEENDIFLKHVIIGRELLKNIPRLENIAEAIGYQEKLFNGEGPPAKKIKGNSIPLISRILKVALDYDSLIEAGCSSLEAQNEMRSKSLWYDPDVLSALYAEIVSAEDGFIVEEIQVKDLEIGMVLADKIETKAGTLLVPKGHEISQVLKLRIRNFASSGNISEPIKVLKLLEYEK